MKTVSTLVVLVLCVSALLAAQVKATEEDSKAVHDLANGHLVPTLGNEVEMTGEGLPRRALKRGHYPRHGYYYHYPHYYKKYYYKKKHDDDEDDDDDDKHH